MAVLLPRRFGARSTYNIGDDARQEEVLLVLVRALLEFMIRSFMLFCEYRTIRQTILRLVRSKSSVAAVLIVDEVKQNLVFNLSALVV